MRCPLLSLIFSTLFAHGQSIVEIHYPTDADNSTQPAMWFSPQTDKPVPLMVALHTWSGDYRQKLHKDIAQWCLDNRWAYIHPDFRGPNRRPEATGSPLVVKDIVSAVRYARETRSIDTNAVYLVGTSGGGYTALVMAGKHPELWAGVSAWVPISDLKAWYHETKKAGLRYCDEIAASCGGAPGDSRNVDEEYRNRSPINYLSHARGLLLHIHAGINDGHTGSVPISHSLLAFNQVAARKDQLSKKEVRYFVEKAKVPEHLKAEIKDPAYGEKQPLFRRTSGKATVTIFNGGHELIPKAAIAWIHGAWKEASGRKAE